MRIEPPRYRYGFASEGSRVNAFWNSDSRCLGQTEYVSLHVAPSLGAREFTTLFVTMEARAFSVARSSSPQTRLCQRLDHRVEHLVRSVASNCPRHRRRQRRRYFLELSRPDFKRRIGISGRSVSGYHEHRRDVLSSAEHRPRAHVTGPIGLVLDKNGDLVIADSTGIASIYRPANQTPTLSFSLTGLIGNANNINLALTGPNDRHLLVARLDAGAIYKYAYPSGTLETAILLPGPTVVEGLATSPASARGVR
jgi:hypothetical protein